MRYLRNDLGLTLAGAESLLIKAVSTGDEWNIRDATRTALNVINREGLLMPWKSSVLKSMLDNDVCRSEMAAYIRELGVNDLSQPALASLLDAVDTRHHDGLAASDELAYLGLYDFAMCMLLATVENNFDSDDKALWRNYGDRFKRLIDLADLACCLREFGYNRLDSAIRRLMVKHIGSSLSFHVICKLNRDMKLHEDDPDFNGLWEGFGGFLGGVERERRLAFIKSSELISELSDPDGDVKHA